MGVSYVLKWFMAIKEFEKSTLINSIGAFAASKNCDLSNPESFYKSYVERKKKVLEGKINAKENGSPVNMEKLKKEIYMMGLWKKYEKEALEIISKLIPRLGTQPGDDGILNRARELLE